MKFDKPNVRKWFIPDIGYTIFDADLQQADAQVVAWEAEDEMLKEIFRDPSLDLHDENARIIFGSVTKHTSQLAKVGVHLTNYAGKARTMARSLGITVAMAEAFQRKWFSVHPGILEWHRRTERNLQTTRTVSNVFGFRIRYMGRIEATLPEALAWVPQSTVARVINEGLNNLEEHPEVTVLMQNHDSIIGQFKHSFYPRRHEILDAMTIVVPYDDPLTMGIDISCSRKSWGDCVDVPWKNEALFCPY